MSIRNTTPTFMSFTLADFGAVAAGGAGQRHFKEHGPATDVEFVSTRMGIR